MAKFTPSSYQQAIFDWVTATRGSGRHLVVNAVAGSGKTTTGVEVFSLLPGEGDIGGIDSAFVAFNSHIAKELKSRLPDGANARTYHSLGLATLKRTYPRIQVDNDKVEYYLKEKTRDARWMIPSTRRLISLCKGTRHTTFDGDELARMAFEHDIDLYDDNSNEAKYKIFELVQGALTYSLDHLDVVDFDDMIWLPNVLENVSFYEYDFLFVDEVQDTNLGQLDLAMNSVNDSGTIVGVGDRRQSLYHFRGADATAIDKFKAALRAEELPLSISYRCPMKIKEYVNSSWPDIKFEVPEWAIDGVIRDTMSYSVENEVQSDDMVLCRVNADLVPLAFSLIRRGIKATIRGRDIGKGLVTLIKKSCATDVSDLIDWMGRWKSKEMEKAIRIGAEDKIAYITDRFETLYALTDGADTVAQVAERCQSLFADEKSGVTLSTVHRAKGLEADRVFIIRPDLMPHPAAKRAIDIQTEENIRYVAVTRTLKELVFVR